ncbi:MAG TPA: hypothetical protein P5267_01930 [Patescibacteria group bacterium]|nr:hypothetical protein [Patescibacteria group bacterium]
MDNNMENKNGKIQATITEEVPEWKLNLAYFYTENKAIIKRILIFALFFFDLTVIMIGGTVYVNYRAGTISDRNYLYALPKNLVNQMAKAHMVPKDLIMGEVLVLRNTEEKNNLLSIIQNDNTNWAVKKLTYAFVVNGQELDTRSTFILPQSNKYLAQFNAPLGTNVDLKIISLEWERMRDYTAVSYKNNIKISGAEFVPNQSSVISGEVNFTIFNETPYNFWEVGLPIILYDQYAEPLAVNYAVINNLDSQEEREVSVNWQEAIYRTVTSVGIYPEVNLLNKEVIMRVKAGPGDPPGLELKSN